MSKSTLPLDCKGWYKRRATCLQRVEVLRKEHRVEAVSLVPYPIEAEAFA